MKFRCERDTFVDLVTTAGRAVSSRSSAPMALSGILLTAAGNSLSAVGTDNDLTIHAEIEAIGLDDGSAVAPAKLVADIVRAMEPGAVTVEANDETIEITAARSRFSLHTFLVADFPAVAKPQAPAVQLGTDALAEALRQVVRAASTDDARPLLTGVLIANEDGGVRLVATDSYRLAMRDIAESAELEGNQILIPARALGEVVRLMGSEKTGAETTVGLSVGQHEATFTVGSVSISTRLLDGTYPEYRELIPASYPNQLNLGKESLLDALRRVKLLVRDNTTPVRLSMRQGGVDLTVVSHDVGDASETVDADYEGEDLTIAFNPTYLIDGVEAVAGDEVVIETVDATKPATVRAAEHVDFRYLLMPVRVA